MNQLEHPEPEKDIFDTLYDGLTTIAACGAIFTIVSGSMFGTAGATRSAKLNFEKRGQLISHTIEQDIVDDELSPSLPAETP